MEHYLPEIQKATAHMRPLPDEEISKLTGNTIGTLMKLFYAFLWQVFKTLIKIFIRTKHYSFIHLK